MVSLQAGKACLRDVYFLIIVMSISGHLDDCLGKAEKRV
jgi:hypothetical protein